MSKPSYITVTPSTGSGNATLSATATAYTGRVARTGAFVITGDNCTALTVNTTQSAASEFVSFDQSSYSVAKTGGTLTITGTSNSSKLTFSIVSGGNLSITAITTYTAAGTSATSGSAITGDPGASEAYAFSIELSIAANTTVDAKSVSILATANGGQTNQVAINQAAGDPYCTFSDGSTAAKSITITAAGTAVSVGILSNTTWAVS